MPFRSAALILVALLQLFAAADLAEAQRQKGKLGGGAGFAWLSNPDVDLGSTANLGGFIGLRFNDNVSVEAGLFYVGSDRVYNEFGEPVDSNPALAIPSFQHQTTRYYADGTLVLNIGRRHPFHPFILFGGGLQRSDIRRTEFTFDLDTVTGLPRLVESEVVLDETQYVPTAIVGGGADIYFMYNLAARAEVRLRVPKEWDDRTFAIFFAATYFF